MSEKLDPKVYLTAEEYDAKIRETLGGEYMHKLKTSYRMMFQAPGAQEAMEDLVKFARVFEPCFDPDPRVHAALEGRREILLRILHFVNMSTADLYRLYKGPPIDRRRNPEDDPWSAAR